MTEVEKRTGPVIEYFEVEGTRFVRVRPSLSIILICWMYSERRLVMGYKMGGTSHLFR